MSSRAAAASSWRACVLGWLLATLCQCSADAVVYRAALAPAPPLLDAGVPQAGAAASDAGARVVGCRSANGGGLAILSELLGRLSEDLQVAERPPCTTDADCSQTFVTPACDETTGSCVPCAGAALQAAFGARLAACLTTAAVSCCRDPQAAPDCLVEACSIGCTDQ